MTGLKIILFYFCLFCSEFKATLGYSNFTTDSVHIYDLNCTGAESSIFNCSHSLANSQEVCPSANDAFIQCNGIHIEHIHSLKDLTNCYAISAAWATV